MYTITSEKLEIEAVVGSAISGRDSSNNDSSGEDDKMIKSEIVVC